MNAPRAILVVAGDHDWADVTALRLVALGCRVRHAVSLPQALAVGTHDSCSVLLIDQCSYADDAAELTAQWRRMWPASRVVVLRDDQLGADAKLLALADRVLPRIRPWREIEHAIEEALDARTLPTGIWPMKEAVVGS